MSDGISDHFAKRRAKAIEDRIIRDFIIFVECILYNQETPRKMLKDLEKTISKMFKQIDT